MKNLWQFIKFGIVGVSNTLISEVIYALVICLHGHYILANFLGFTISVFNAYFWSNRYVFKQEAGEKKRVWWKTLLKTYVAYIAGFLLNIGLLFLWVDVVEISRFMDPFRMFLEGFHITYFDNKMLGDLIAQMLCLPITVPVNYLVNKYWAYRKQEKKEA